MPFSLTNVMCPRSKPERVEVLGPSAHSHWNWNIYPPLTGNIVMTRLASSESMMTRTKSLTPLSFTFLDTPVRFRNAISILDDVFRCFQELCTRGSRREEITLPVWMRAGDVPCFDMLPALLRVAILDPRLRPVR